MGHEKAEKQVVKVIKCIYPEPGILILLRVPFDLRLKKSLQTVLDQRTTISSQPPKKGWRNRCHPDFFQYSCGFPGFLGPVFQNRPTVDVQPPKEQKQQKTAFLLLLRKAVFSFFRHRQRNDFRLSVRDVLEFDRGRRRWGLTGSRDGRND